MLESIVINNFTIIDRSQIEFAAGMTALTGETGAGKSILLDAINLVLGDRADSDTVKNGADKADISVTFDISTLTNAKKWLVENDLDQADDCLLRRVIQSNGRSKAYINGTPVTLSQLKALGEMLVDIHGQHDHQSLQKPNIQRQLLDDMLPEHDVVSAVEKAFKEWKGLKHQLVQARDQSAEKQHRLDLLQLYTRELHELNLKDGEITQLQDEYNRLSHAGQIVETMTSVIDDLYEKDTHNIQSQLSHCVQQLNQVTHIDSSLTEASELIGNALIQIEEASAALRGYSEDLDLDPARLDWLNQRINEAQSLARKHQTDINDLFKLTELFDQELDHLQLSEHDIEQLETKVSRSAEEYLASARALSKLRQQTARQLSQQITEVMQTLGMQGGAFTIQIKAQEEESAFSSHGIDTVDFQISPNPGQPLKPLSKVASGGELSRMSLAIQVILSESSRIPTLIFDEVDSGIGGGIAEIVGRKLREIAHHRQVFCVTHLPQVASQAHQHYQVTKRKTDTTTSTNVMALDENERLEEIARMLGGMTITEQTRAHAQEMLDSVA